MMTTESLQLSRLELQQRTNIKFLVKVGELKRNQRNVSASLR